MGYYSIVVRVKTKILKHSYLWLGSVFNSSACNCVLSGKLTSSSTSILFIGFFFIIFHRRSFLQFKCMNIHIFTCFFAIYGSITSSHRVQLPVGLIAQLVEYCTNIAEVMLHGFWSRSNLVCGGSFSTRPRREGRGTLPLMEVLSIKTIWKP